MISGRNQTAMKSPNGDFFGLLEHDCRAVRSQRFETVAIQREAIDIRINVRLDFGHSSSWRALHAVRIGHGVMPRVRAAEPIPAADVRIRLVPRISQELSY